MKLQFALISLKSSVIQHNRTTRNSISETNFWTRYELDISTTTMTSKILDITHRIPDQREAANLV